MLKARYYKIAGKWYFDYPEYTEKGGHPDDLERVGAMYDLLEYIADGQSSVTLLLDFEPFEGAEEGVLVATSGGNSGAYYHLHTLQGKVVDLEIWVDELIYLQNMELPQKIYGKPI